MFTSDCSEILLYGSSSIGKFGSVLQSYLLASVELLRQETPCGLLRSYSLIDSKQISHLPKIRASRISHAEPSADSVQPVARVACAMSWRRFRRKFDRWLGGDEDATLISNNRSGWRPYQPWSTYYVCLHRRVYITLYFLQA